MVSSEKKLANVIGGKTARACDSCIRKRARWYCAADDAFLCQFCDTLVHSANPLARGHERVRLNISSLNVSSLEIQTPTWQRGITKKSRTPRGKNNNKHASHGSPKSQKSCMKLNTLHIVPESESDELTILDSDERLPYDRVPEYDPFSGELSFSMEFHDMAAVSTEHAGTHYNKLPNLTSPAKTKYDESEDSYHLNSLILPSDLELAEFAADVESLLGNNNLDEEESFHMEALGMLDCRLNDSLKVEEEVQLSLDYDHSPVVCEDEERKVDGMDIIHIGVVVKSEDEKCEVVCDEHANIHDTLSNKDLKMLKLDYEGVIASWDDDRSPWTTGDRPELDPDDCCLDCLGECGKVQHYRCGETGVMMGNPSRVDGGREARVSRYREKRRTRLFSKKIRYQVRKVNAEKRPRMKGRFVKRTSFAV
uniref:zinc finger protein CONSTANS-LIKE 6-like n=1 Tax=Erigeron canadensis TaxID=72917 RepID=UPI001CB8B745|nr:zinc finger protein CONSTANS-LIKE 6-like [Erigeron canadensis]